MSDRGIGNPTAPVVLGWRVVEPGAKGPNQPRRISRTIFTVKSSAEDLATLAKRTGHPDAYVAEVVGLEGKE